MKPILATIAIATSTCALCLPAGAQDRDHGRIFEDQEHHERWFGGNHEGRGHGTHIPVVPETSPAPVLGALFLIGAIAYEVKRRRPKAKLSQEA
jgi:hypothetical protein